MIQEAVGIVRSQDKESQGETGLRQGGGDGGSIFRDERMERAPRDALKGRERVKERERRGGELSRSSQRDLG